MSLDTGRHRLPDELACRLQGGENVLICALPDTGPHAGHRVVVVAARDDLDEALRSLQELDRPGRRQFMESVRRSVRGALARPAAPNTDGDLMADLVILLAHKLAAGGSDRVLEGSGVATLELMIEPDGCGLTWRERGMLDPELERALKLPTSPRVLAN